MLGAIVLSEYNDIVHIFGNVEFHRLIQPQTESKRSKSGKKAVVKQKFMQNGVMDRATPILRAENTSKNIESYIVETKNDALPYSCASLESTESPCSSVSCEVSSSTSGVASSSVESFPSSNENHLKNNQHYNYDNKNCIKKVEIKNNEDHGKKNEGQLKKLMTKSRTNKSIPKKAIDRSNLLDRILPLIVIYRMNKELHASFLASMDILYDVDDDNDSDYKKLDSDTNLKFKLMIDSRNIKFRITNYERVFVLILIVDEKCTSTTINYLRCIIMRALDYHYGRTIRLLESDTNPQIQTRVERRVNKLIERLSSESFYNDVFNVNLTYGNTKMVATLLHSLKELTVKIAKKLQRKCRYIFVKCNQIIGSLCSDDRAPSLLDTYTKDSLAALLEFSLQDANVHEKSLHDNNNTPLLSLPCLKCQTEVAWLYSKILACFQCVSVNVFSLTAEITLICLSNVSHASAIISIADTLEHVDLFMEPLLKSKSNTEENFSRYQTNCLKTVGETQKKLENVFSFLKDFKFYVVEKNDNNDQNMTLNNYTNEGKYIYLANLSRTEKLVKSQWLRLCEQLSKYLQYESTTMNRRESNATSYCYNTLPASALARLGSSLSLISNNSSIAGSADYNRVYSTVRSVGTTSDETGFRSGTSRRSVARSSLLSAVARASLIRKATTIDNGHISVYHLNAMLMQLCRTLRGLFRELIEFTSINTSRQLNELHITVRQSVDRRLGDEMETLLRMCVSSWKCGSPLRPLRLGLDMLAFRVKRTNMPFNYYFIPKIYQSIFSEFKRIESDFLIAKTDEGLLLIQASKCEEYVSNSAQMTTRRRSRFKSAKTVEDTASNYSNLSADEHMRNTTTCTAIFPEYINAALAIRQAYQLIELLDPQIDDVIRSMN